MEDFDQKMDNWIDKMEELVKGIPQVGEVYEFVSDLYDSVDANNADDNSSSEYVCIEIDGVEYIVFKEFSIDEDTYYYLVSTENPTNVMFRKLLVEDGVDYMVRLDDEEEFDLAYLYLQKIMLTEIRSLQTKRESKQTEDSTDT